MNANDSIGLINQNKPEPLEFVFTQLPLSEQLNNRFVCRRWREILDGMPPFKERLPFIERLHSEMFIEIFRLIPFHKLQSLREVCRTWQVIVDDPANQQFYTKTFDYYHFPRWTGPDVPLRILSKVGQRGLQKVQLDTFKMLADEHVESLKGISTRELSIISPGKYLTSAGLAQLFGYPILESPATLILQNNLQHKPCVNDEVLQKLIDRKKEECDFCLSHLTLNYKSEITSDKFCEFVRAGCLASSCELCLLECSWVDDQVIDTFIACGIKFSKLELSSELKKEQIIRLIQGGALESLCDLRHVDREINSQTLAALKENNVQIKNLCMGIRVSSFEQQVIEFIQGGGLASDCSIELLGESAKRGILQALRNVCIKNFKILDLENDDPFQQELENLFKFGKWSNPCQIDINMHFRSIDLFLQYIAANCELKIDQLSLTYKQMSASAFSSVLERFVSGELTLLPVRNPDNSGRIIDSLLLDVLTASKIHLSELDLDGNLDAAGEESLLKLIQSPVLSSVETLTLPGRLKNSESILESLAYKPLITLMLRKTKIDSEKLLTLFSCRENFRFLQILHFQDCELEDGFLDKLREIAPNLFIYTE